MSKLQYFALFMLLTVLHLCAHLHPLIEANASIKSNYPDVDHSLDLRLRYEYRHSMLLQAVVNSMLVVVGVWRYQRHVAEQQQQLLLPSATATRSTGMPSIVSEAAQIRYSWLLKTLHFKVRLISLKYSSWFLLPWLITFVLSSTANYLLLNLVMQHFCASQLQVLMLYVRMQLLFLRNVLEAAVQPYWTQLSGAFEGVAATHVNYISYETQHLLNSG